MFQSRTPADDVDRHVGLRLRVRRRECKISQQELGRVIGVTFQQIQKYERGVNRMSASTIYKMATALGAPVSHFFEGLPASGPSTALDTPRIRGLGEFLAEPGGVDLMAAYLGMPRRLRREVLALASRLAGPAAGDSPGAGAGRG
jgi:transcriptional regulator with XRE-family HTH domain